MKHKRFVFTLCIVFLVGILLTAIGLAFGGKTVVYLSNDGISIGTNETSESTYQELSSNIQTIDLQVSTASDVRIVSGDTFSVTYNAADCTLTTTGNALSLRSKNTLGMSIGIDNTSETNTIVIAIPQETTLTGISLDLSVNQLSIDDITVGQLLIDVSLGNVSITNSTIQNMQLEVDAGKATLTDTTIAQAEIEVSAGDITIENCAIEQSIQLDADTGSVHCSNTSLPNRAEFEVSLGDLTLALVGSAADYTIETELTLGTFSLNGVAQPSIALVGNGTKKLTLEIEVGNCALTFTEDTQTA